MRYWHFAFISIDLLGQATVSKLGRDVSQFCKGKLAKDLILKLFANSQISLLQKHRSRGRQPWSKTSRAAYGAITAIL
jgi:hypothetical protein